MKDLIVQRLILSMFMMLMLVFSIHAIADALIREIVVPGTPEPRTLESSRKATTVPIATKDDVAISEIMYATNANKPPQWIELHNRSARKVSLEEWEVTIENHPEDTTVLANTLTFTLDAKVLHANQVLLLVTEQGLNSGIGVAKGDFHEDCVVDLKDLIGGTPGYRLLSQTAFKITLTAPAATRTESKTSGDIAGNLDATPEWELPLSDDKRISIIRKYNHATSALYDGTTADGWELATEKDYPDTLRITYYGHHSDHGTPGYREADPLPVELSSFRPMRERFSTAVVITWKTESEVNNAGFNIKRSTTKDSGFEVINPAVIPGAGTTNEERVYTYTDVTAKPKIVYYYQLECVSVDGTHQTLRTTHLRGNVNAGRSIEYILWRW